jgi:mono/diheme cytochrome c family protein
MRRSIVALVIAIGGVGAFAGGAAWLLTDPRPPAGASRGERLFYAYCIECHGVDGRGSWRAALFLLKPGDLAQRGRGEADRYLFDIIKQGGAAYLAPPQRVLFVDGINEHFARPFYSHWLGGMLDSPAEQIATALEEQR